MTVPFKQYPLWSKNTRVFVDTCSLMEATSADFMWNYLVPTLRGYGVPPLIVAKAVVDELNRLATQRSDSKARYAQTAKKIVQGLIDEGNAKVIGEDNDTFPDNLFQDVFTRYRLKYRLILITQDSSLAKDILSLNNSNSVNRIHGIDAFRIGDRGDPMRWILDPSHLNGVKYYLSTSEDGFVSAGSSNTVLNQRQSTRISRRVRYDRAPTRGKQARHQVAPFKLQQRAAQLVETPVTITSIPGQGDIVKDKNEISLSLGAELGRGGEGIIYVTDNPKLVCKIYQRDRLKQFTIDKLNLMISREIRHPAICWPISLAYNSRGEIVGYLMPKAKGKELQRTVFIKPLLEKTFPHWTRLHLVRLTSKILDAVAYLHSLNVLLGDINGRNFIVQDESSVFFVDCDSYQVEGFPCPVGMPPYLAPELNGKELRSTIRKEDAELFAIATLVFMILHPGKPPYSHQGGEDPLKNVQKRHFPYPRGDQGAKWVPDGPWRFIFSHLPWYMKDAFHQVFSDGDRLTVADWQELMRRYKNDLGKGYVSADLFPTGFKQLTQEQCEKNGGKWRTCSVCGKGFCKFEDEHTTCLECFRNRRSSKNSASSARSARHTAKPRKTFFRRIFYG